MGFSPTWLSLREPADRRARSADLGETLARHLARRERPLILDLGCGTGSNLRALAPHLGPRQDWVLVDYDPALLEAAHAHLVAWADAAAHRKDAIFLHHGEKRIDVRFVRADLAQGLDKLLELAPDCVTASALFDFCSTAFIADAAARIARSGAAFLTVLTYDGMERWEPAHPADDAVLAAFIAHQRTDKGFGVSAGPDASRQLAQAFSQVDYTVLEASTPWILEAPRDSALIAELAGGIVAAVLETQRVTEAEALGWHKARLAAQRTVIGHRDCLALPPSGPSRQAHAGKDAVFADKPMV